jgi:hypothetical protein
MAIARQMHKTTAAVSYPAAAVGVTGRDAGLVDAEPGFL